MLTACLWARGVLLLEYTLFPTGYTRTFFFPSPPVASDRSLSWTNRFHTHVILVVVRHRAATSACWSPRLACVQAQATSRRISIKVELLVYQNKLILTSYLALHYGTLPYPALPNPSSPTWLWPNGRESYVLQKGQLRSTLYALRSTLYALRSTLYALRSTLYRKGL
jgi:hypothetical protein